MSYSLEQLFEVWDDKHGDKIEIGADRDGLNLAEMRYVQEGKCTNRFVMPYEMAMLVHEALGKYLEIMKTKNE